MLHRYIVVGEDFKINVTASVVGFLNREKEIIRSFDFMPYEDEDGIEHMGLVLEFVDLQCAREFLELYPRFEQKSVTLADRPTRIVALPLGADDLLYLFHEVLHAEQLLQDPTVPPLKRVNLLECFVKEKLEQFVFPPEKRAALQVDFSPVRFVAGKLAMRLRGSLPQAYDTRLEPVVVNFSGFSKLALVCFNTPETARFIKPFKSMLCAVHKDFMLSTVKTARGDLRPLLSQSLRIQGLAFNHTGGHKIVVTLIDSLPGGMITSKLYTYMQLLQEALKHKYEVRADLVLNHTNVVIKPAFRKSVFVADEIDSLRDFFLASSELFARDGLAVQAAGSFHASFQGSLAEEEQAPLAGTSLGESFVCAISSGFMREPVVIDSAGNCISRDAAAVLVAQGAPNPFSRQPIVEGDFRPNRMLQQLIVHYSANPISKFPEVLAGIKQACLLPDGSTVCAQALRERNGLSASEFIGQETELSLEDGGTIKYKDLWANRLVQGFIDFYANIPEVEPTAGFFPAGEVSDSPLQLLAARVSCLLSLPSALTTEEAKEALLQDNLPVHIAWNSVTGLRISFVNPDLGFNAFRMLCHRGVDVESIEVAQPYKECLLLSGEPNIRKFLFDVCCFNPEYKGFDRVLNHSGEFSALASAKRKKADPLPAAATTADIVPAVVDDSEKSREQLLCESLHEMFYGDGHAIRDKLLHLRRSQYMHHDSGAMSSAITPGGSAMEHMSSPEEVGLAVLWLENAIAFLVSRSPSGDMALLSAPSGPSLPPMPPWFPPPSRPLAPSVASRALPSSVPSPGALPSSVPLASSLASSALPPAEPRPPLSLPLGGSHPSLGLAVTPGGGQAEPFTPFDPTVIPPAPFAMPDHPPSTAIPDLSPQTLPPVLPASVGGPVTPGFFAAPPTPVDEQAILASTMEVDAPEEEEDVTAAHNDVGGSNASSPPSSAPTF